ncbi:MAG TPA: D-2-hydroxyacid dehydrogenase [Pirellulaceae bacterium]|nr:D-2-hydroxyacid dehydrogenase [Pirellulaceae bacterium]HMO91835.1 D-2-hydroxyacid dehydrogenase [Pirellulaceae bacterium]HMP69898.1 D-2-hydroxyacid dehydrogenase [Pirellulaceae bacterium]
MKIVVLDGFTLNPGDSSWQSIAALGDLTVHDRTEPNHILERANNAEILLTNKTPLTATTIAALPKLKFISVIATGYNVVDVNAAAERGIPVANVPEYGTATVAQHVFAMLLSFIHRPFLHDQAIRDGEWSRRQDFSFWLNSITELDGLVFGVVGFGRIGRRVAKIAKAFGMTVIVSTRSPKASDNDENVEFVELDELFRRADVISLHCPLTENTRGLVNRRRLQLAKPSAILINSARGDLVNEADLAEALNANRLAGACLDVFSTEPLPTANPLFQAKNCLLTPHYAWVTLAARQRLMKLTAENVAAFLSGRPINVVNLPANR